MYLCISFDDPAKLKTENMQSEGLPINKPTIAGMTASIIHGIIITYFLIFGSIGNVYLQYALNLWLYTVRYAFVIVFRDIATCQSMDKFMYWYT
jgi:hypothetical protein